PRVRRVPRTPPSASATRSRRVGSSATQGNAGTSGTPRTPLTSTSTCSARTRATGRSTWSGEPTSSTVSGGGSRRGPTAAFARPTWRSSTWLGFGEQLFADERRVVGRDQEPREARPFELDDERWAAAVERGEVLTAAVTPRAERDDARDAGAGRPHP